MTVIAWDGRTLVADRRCSAPDGKCFAVRKIFVGRHAGELLALTGEASIANELRAWYMGGAVPADFPAFARDGCAELNVIRRDSAEQYNRGPQPVSLHAEEAICFGSGADIARGVLHMGGTARQAVEAACLYRGDCGSGIDTMELIE